MVNDSKCVCVSVSGTCFFRMSVSVCLFQERVVQNECVCGCFRKLLKRMSVSVCLFQERVVQNECSVAVSGSC